MWEATGEPAHDGNAVPVKAGSCHHHRRQHDRDQRSGSVCAFAESDDVADFHRGVAGRLDPQQPCAFKMLRLGIACGIEYAAQAMAVHGALAGSEAADGTGAHAAGARSEAGFLASVRNVRLHVVRLDDIESDLVCEAELLAGDRGSALYDFAITSAELPLLSGRATVVFDADKRLQQL